MLLSTPHEGGIQMTQILIVADSPEEKASTIVYRERIVPTDLESNHFSDQLVEGVGWAVRDADQLEHQNRPPMTTANRP
jgi:hypothetical protein